MTNQPGSPSIPGRMEKWFSPGGTLSTALDGFESRPAQLQLAEDIHQTLLRGGVLFGEAPTGVGKSLAYLVPSFLLAETRGEPVVISTYTKSLQGQLLDQDVPQLARAAGRPIDAVVLKGKSNYYCARRHRLLVAEAKRSGRREESIERDFSNWIATNEVGDLEGFPWRRYRGGLSFRSRIAADPSFCGEGVCRASKECCFRRARRRAASADLVIVNHALLVSGKAAGGVLPPFRSLIIDEAQHLETAITSQLTRTVSFGRFRRALDGWGSPGRGKGGLLGELDTGILAPVSGAQGPRLAEEAANLAALRPKIVDAAKVLFSTLTLKAEAKSPYPPRRRFRTQEEILGKNLSHLDDLLQISQQAETTLSSLATLLGRMESSLQIEEWRSDAEGALGEWRGLVRDLEELTDPLAREFVHWRSGAEAERTEIAAAPVDITASFREWLLSELESLCLVSATLRVGDSFDYMRGRLGLGADSPLDVRTATYETPFDWKRQVRAFLSRDADPDPQRVAHLVVRLHKRIQRNMLVLFTSHAALRRAKAILAEELPVETPLWAQNVDGDATELADRFRNVRGAVLLGTSSFWEGVDFPGAALEVLIITKLPFSVPDDPLVEARCERIEESGGSGFRELLLPDAVLRFRQGIGRLLRRKTDRGIVVLTDPRAVTRSYGSVFRRALPVPLTETASDEELAQAAFRFLEEDSQSGSSPVSEQPMNAESKQ